MTIHSTTLDACLLMLMIQACALLSSVITYRGLRRVGRRLKGDGARFIPATVLGREFPRKRIRDQDGNYYHFGEEILDFSLLVISKNCPVCHNLGVGLRFHSRQLTRRGEFFLFAVGDPGELAEFVAPAHYPILSDKEVAEFLDLHTIPVLLTIRSGTITGAYVVNGIDHIYSVVRLESQGDRRPNQAPDRSPQLPVVS